QRCRLGLWPRPFPNPAWSGYRGASAVGPPRPGSAIHDSVAGMLGIVAILIAFIFGVAGGFWASDLVKWVALSLRSFIAGGIGGVVGSLAFQFMVPALSSFDDWHAILSQMVAAFVGGALLTVIVGVMAPRERR